MRLISRSQFRLSSTLRDFADLNSIAQAKAWLNCHETYHVGRWHPRINHLQGALTCKTKAKCLCTTSYHRVKRSAANDWRWLLHPWDWQDQVFVNSWQQDVGIVSIELQSQPRIQKIWICRCWTDPWTWSVTHWCHWCLSVAVAALANFGMSTN